MKKMHQTLFNKNKLQKTNREDGFMSIIVLLISLLILGLLFAKMYATPKASDGKTQIETYDQAIKEAENIKKTIEMKNVDVGI